MAGNRLSPLVAGRAGEYISRTWRSVGGSWGRYVDGVDCGNESGGPFGKLSR